METNIVHNTAEAPVLTTMEIDAIGEVLNISMGSAATAISTMLDKQVSITTPQVTVESLESIDCGSLEPAIIVKIMYTQGIAGSNVMVFRQRDMQLILNSLMGIDDPPSDDFVFDELSMSAACEVMNQMMGASATALSEFLGRSINISTPTAIIMDEQNTFIDAVGVPPQESIVAVLFTLNIAGVINSEFVSVLSCDLAKVIINQFMDKDRAKDKERAAAKASIPAQATAAPSAPHPQQARQQPAMPQQQQAPQQQAVPQQAQFAQQPGMPAQTPYQQMPPIGQQYQPYPQQMPGYPPMYPYGYQQQQQPYLMYDPNQLGQEQPVNVKPVQFPEFSPLSATGEPVMSGNMNLIMNVPLSVSIEIGKTKKKIKDIMAFTQGTVIELEKQAGAPIDIVVNGQLLAHGDVVVIDDNFGVRITEIVGTKELLNSLEEHMK